MIRSTRGKHAAAILSGKAKKGFPPDIIAQAERKLRLLGRARSFDDLRFPKSNNLEALKADRKGQYSIRINDQWRICFRWDDSSRDAYDVEITDYH